MFHQLIGAGDLANGYATDAGAGLHYAGTKLMTAIADRKNAGAYWVERQGNGVVREEELDVQRLKR